MQSGRYFNLNEIEDSPSSNKPTRVRHVKRVDLVGPRNQVAAWKNHRKPEERLRFWTHPEIEVDLAVQAGAKVLRLGVDWERVMPTVSVIWENQLVRYRQVSLILHVDMLRSYNTLQCENG